MPETETWNCSVVGFNIIGPYVYMAGIELATPPISVACQAAKLAYLMAVCSSEKVPIAGGT